MPVEPTKDADSRKHAGTLAARLQAAGTPGDDEERAFNVALDGTLAALLPQLGAVFGIAVVLFSVWDYWIAPGHAAATTALRLTLVLVGALGYIDWGPRVSVAWRCGLVYVTHSGAMILSSALLPGGLVLALPAITGIMFPLALLEPRLPRLFLLLLFPSALFAALGAAVLAPQALASSLLVYLACLGLAACTAVAQGRMRRAAFLAERALAYSAHHDSLSGVLARGYLMELAEHDLALAKRYGRPLAVCMLDIDHFKRVNDHFGHPAGDALIREVSKACSSELRASDYFGRVGGEEFVCVMPETTEEEARACAERMRLAVAAIRLATPAGPVRCTISIGIAALEPAHVDFGVLLAAADAALYQAKESGRDRVVLAERTSS
ncbi:GGDEF domain-containing protein [Massilia sp. ST3]|uniref:GGDEF domain-containing protein n=1 Tax=Massilia sp. ST3 TaxID=2824903 RepID=UPI001B81F868|nr:GGDEF domain-containing protein [Massilia sp. ST3]MBQ5948488.1 diguanylate cyclase [Massilia sp. ST3]